MSILDHFRFQPQIRLVRPLFETRSRKLYHANREAARLLVHQRVSHFSRHYSAKHGISIGRITIRNQKSRWGSCSKKGNLNFNYKLVFLPPELCDYVIVHELLHFSVPNHGKLWKSLMRAHLGDYETLESRLNSLGSTMPSSIVRK